MNVRYIPVVYTVCKRPAARGRRGAAARAGAQRQQRRSGRALAIRCSACISMAPTTKLRAAIIGAGGRARSSHYVCVSRLSEQVELGAMAELDPVLMQEVSEEFGIPRTYDDYTEMLATETELGLDIVYCIMNERYVLQPALDCINSGERCTPAARCRCTPRLVQHLRQTLAAARRMSRPVRMTTHVLDDQASR